MQLEDAIGRVVNNGSETLIKCVNEVHQESVRVAAFHIRKRMERILGIRDIMQTVGIQKFNEGGNLFIRIYKKEKLEIWVRDESGKLIPLIEESPPDFSPERVAELMRRDGKTEEEIETYLKE